MQKNAVMYCRVSTKEQVEEGNSLASQEKYCKDYILKNSDNLVMSFIEQGESAKTAQRPQLQKLLAYCSNRKNKISYVVAYKLDRIARNTADYSQIRLVLKRYDIEIKSTSEFFEDTPAGRFMENIIANVAQFDNDVRAERCAGGMRDAMREGRYVWCAAIGYKNAKVNGKSTIIHSAMAPLILELFQKVAQNLHSVYDLKREFDKKGLINSKGKCLSKSQYYRLLKNRLYAGWIIKFKECHRGLFDPIVSDELFEQVQKVLKQRKRNGSGYNIDNEHFPLRRFFRHPNGLQLTGSWVQGKLRKYPYYCYHMRGQTYPKEKLNAYFKKHLSRHSLKELHYKGLKKALHVHFDRATEEKQKTIAVTKQKIENLKTRQQQLIDKNLGGTISDTILRQQLEEIESDLMNAQASLSIIETTTVDFGKLLQYVSEFLLNPSIAWEAASIYLKRKLQVFYFPQGIIFDGMKSKTPETCMIFKVKSEFLDDLSHRVDFSTQNKNTPKVQNSSPSQNNPLYISSNDETEFHKNISWNRIAHELVLLGNLKDESKKDYKK